MGSFLRQHPIAVVLSTLLHAALVMALTVGFDRSGRRRVAMPVEQVAIEATGGDASLLQQELERLEELEQVEVARQQEEERQAREQAEAARQEREEAARQEDVRLAEVERQRDEAEQQRVAEEARLVRVREEEAQRQREEEARLAREREEEAQRQREEEARLAQEREEEAERQRQAEAAARQRAEMEAELQRALALEDERRQAEEAGLLDEYIRLIENRIQQNWIPPASARAGLECVVNVTQIPSGDVVDVRVGRCNGDDAVVRSIEAAVLRSSPLPRPPTPSLFERNLEVVFNPEV